MNPILWGFLAVSVIVAWIMINNRIFDDICSPFLLLLPSWIFPLLLTLLNLSNKIHPWGFEVVLIVLLPTIILTVISLGASVFLIKPCKKWNGAAFSKLLDRLNTRHFSVLLVSCHLLGLAGLVYNELVTNPVGIPMLTYLRQPDIPRDPNWLWKGGTWWFLSIPAFALGPFLYLKFRTAAGFFKRFVYLALALGYPAVELIKMSRSECIYGLSGLCLMEYYYRKFLRKGRGKAVNYKQRIQIAVVVIVAAVGSGTVFSNIRANKPISSLAGMMGIEVALPDPYASTVVEFYTYFALPFENLNNLVSNYPRENNLGVGGLRPLYSMTGNGLVVRDRLDKINVDSYLQMFPANTYPILTQLYLEAGWLSLIVFTVLYAGWINLGYVSFRRSPTLTSAASYILPVTFLWVWMFSNSNFTGIQYYLIVAVGVALPIIDGLLKGHNKFQKKNQAMQSKPTHALT